MVHFINMGSKQVWGEINMKRTCKIAIATLLMMLSVTCFGVQVSFTNNPLRVGSTMQIRVYAPTSNSKISIKIFDLNRRTVLSETHTPGVVGDYNIPWNGTVKGKYVNSGVYILHVEVGSDKGKYRIAFIRS